MNFSSINIQGNIISSEILDKIRSEEKYKYQQPEAFGLARTASLRDEIGLAWSVMRTHWQAYKKRLETMPKGDTGTSLTREKLILPLLNELGYEVAIQKAQQISGKSYAISHGASNRDLFPIHVMGYNDHLDKRRDNSGPRLSPHALVQEYLNNTEHLYALVTNGQQLRLLRDATRLVRMSYLEFDFERMFEEELYADFSMLYRLLHASRMPEKVDMGAESIIEYYHQESMASGIRIREKLSEAVEDSIKTLANGFLAHPKNEGLVFLFENNQLNPETYYMYQLRLIYRMLFLIVLEERKLVYPDSISEDQHRLRDIYYKYYSIERLRKLTENRVYVEADKYDLWESLKTTFLIFEQEQYGSKLGIKPLGSGLFAPDALGILKDLFLKNGDLIEVLKRLTTFIGEQGQLVRVNYSDLDVEEFGSVYEGLLEYDPVVEQIGAQWEFSFIAGEGRSSSGSHYTPEELVKPLIKHSLDYIIADKVASGLWLVVGTNHSSQSTNHYKIAPYETIKKLSGLNSLAEINELSKRDLLFYKVLSERRDIWIDFANSQGISKHSGQYSRGTGEEHQGGVSAISGNSERFFSGSRDFDNFIGELGFSDKAKLRQLVESMRGDKQIAERINQIIKNSDQWPVTSGQQTSHLPLTTHHIQLSTLPTEEALLSITVCDVACGSGHILLSAARKIATELASLREGAEQPSPTFYRTALRDVIRQCIYGVDLNPLAVELAKVALWMEAHNPGEPLNFLDHHIKCGNAIVGLAHRDELDRGIAAEAFKTLPNDDKDVAKLLRDKNNAELKQAEAKAMQLKAEFEKTTTHSVQEAMAEYRTFNKLPETTPEEIKAKQKAYKKFIDGKGYTFLKAMADVQVAQFFIPKTKENQQRLMTDAEYRLILSGWKGWQDPKIANAMVVSHEKRFFHWFLEFPEVFNIGGFDCILGNPPYLGGKKISGTYGDDFLNFLLTHFAPAGGQSDFVLYFFKRVLTIIKEQGFLSLITTNTISQGDTREFGLDIFVKEHDVIFANTSIKWPGVASLEVTLITIYKNKWTKIKVLGNQEVKYINSYLSLNEFIQKPNVLKKNQGLSFKGSYIGGLGFTLDEQQAKQLVQKDFRNKEIIKKYITGGDVNNSIALNDIRWVIDFGNRTLSEAKIFEDCFNIVYQKVKPERDKAKRQSNREKWWVYCEVRPGLYGSIKNNKKVICVSQVTKHLIFRAIKNDFVFDTSLIVFPFEDYNNFVFLQNTLFENWSRQYGSSLESRLRFTPTDCFESYPFPNFSSISLKSKLETLGLQYQESRNIISRKLILGLTKIYNLFHEKALLSGIINIDFKANSKINIEKQYSKEVWNLWNHLQKTEGACTWEEAIQGIVELRQLHKQMDEAVLEAYGWHEDTEKWGKAINLRHDFYEVDYLPENDRVRYTIHPEARKGVLKRLLLLNHERYEEEVKQGLHKKEDAEKFYAEKGKELPAEVAKIYAKGYAVSKKKPSKVKEADTEYKKQGITQTSLAFDIPQESKTDIKVTLQKQDGTMHNYQICDKGNIVAKDYQHLQPNRPLAEIIKAKEQGGKFQFEGVWYMILQKQ